MVTVLYFIFFLIFEKYHSEELDIYAVLLSVVIRIRTHNAIFPPFPNN